MKHATLHKFFNEAVNPPLNRLGAGWRSVVMLPPGRKWITLVDWTTLEVIKMRRADWEKLKPEAISYRSNVVLRTMKQRLKYSVTDDGKPVVPSSIKLAIKQLKGSEAA